MITNKFYVIIIFLNIIAINYARESLDELAIKHGADKSSRWHGYTHMYAKNFESFYDKPVTFLEIGTEKSGNSAKMWEEYFIHPDARLITADICPDCFLGVKNLQKTKFYVVDQSNKQMLLKLAQEIKEFDIIVDDGNHVSQDQIETFKTLFPYIKPGGYM